MMSLIMMTNTSSTSVSANAVIPLTTTSRRKGCNIKKTDSGILIKHCGFYKVSGTITFTAGDGVALITLTKDGNVVTGISTSTTTATATTPNTYTLNIDGIIRVLCTDGQPIINLYNDGIAITTSNVNLSIIEL